jgi:squalene synthase HpnC
MHAALLELTAVGFPDGPSVMSQARAENFPVAARVLSHRDRRHLFAVYGFARLADEIGDELVGERLAALDWLELELDRAFAGQARTPLLRALEPTIFDCGLPRAPLARLIEANRMDQLVARYETWEHLLAYCALSANPVGELVLHVFGLASPERIALSNHVCTALQLVEHLQDVAEDLRRGRIYLPAEDLMRFGSSHAQLIDFRSDLGDAVSSGRLRGLAHRRPPSRSATRSRARAQLGEVVEFEVIRARELLGAGTPLVSAIQGREKIAVAAFVAGGCAALEQIERAGFDVLGGVPRPSRRGRLRALVSVLVKSRG